MDDLNAISSLYGYDCVNRDGTVFISENGSERLLTTVEISEVSVELVRLQSEYDSKEYARNRALAYPTLAEQADMAYWDRQNGTTTLDDAITAVKLKYPKGAIA